MENSENAITLEQLERGKAKNGAIVDDLNPDNLKWPSHRMLFNSYFRAIWKMGDIVMAECKLCKIPKVFKSNLAVSPMSFARHLMVNFPIETKTN